MIRIGILFMISLLILSNIVYCSPGDQLDEFQNCVKKCDFLTCDNSHRYEFNKKELRLLNRQQRQYLLFEDLGVNLWMKILGWTCYDNCDYQCQRIVTNFRKINEEEIYQFHGKWPFLRVLGIQELFSFIFSIGNFIPHYIGFNKLRIQYNNLQQSDEFRIIYFNYLIIAVTTMIAWFFSTLFHLKDTWNRERLDYFCAGLAVLSGFHAITIRVFKLYTPMNSVKRLSFSIVVILMYIYHVTRLTNEWSYTYNMQLNVFIGVCQYCMYVFHALKSYLLIIPHKDQPLRYLNNTNYNWTLTPLLLVTSVLFGMSFELFDFPPLWDLIDAHSIWHFITIWPLFFWYDYMIKDTESLEELKFD